MKWIPYAAAATVTVVLAVCYLAFPNVETRTVVKRVQVDPYAAFETSQVVTEQINGQFESRCVFLENRRGITQGTSPPQEGDTIVVRCEAVKSKGGS